MALPFDAVGNFGYSTVLTAPSPATSGTSMILASGGGSLFPDPATAQPYNLFVYPPDTGALLSNAEIVRVTARSGDTLSTMIRAQEGTSARAIAAGWQVALGPTKKVMEDMQAQTFVQLEVSVPASSSATGSTGQWACSGGNFYLCIAANTWVMFPIVDSF